MEPELIKFILLINLVILQFVWRLTSRLNFKFYLTNLSNFRLIIPLITGLVMLLQILEFIEFRLPYLFQNDFFSFFGIILNIGGLLLAIWSKFTMKTNWGLPAQHDIKKQKKLVISGPYTFSRNPIYLGLIIFFAGFELALNSWLIILTVPLIYLIGKTIAVEEKLLLESFGKDYLEYQKKVPRLL